jgi:hypothetical protein
VTTYPFALPGTLPQRLPPPARDGRHYLDVRFAGRWDGILVVDREGLCVGVYVGRRVQEYPLPFAPEDIEDLRPASPWNRFQAALPGDPWGWALLAILVISPVSLAVAQSVAPWLALLPVAACAAAIRIMYGVPGFPFIRFPVALCGLAQILSGVVTVVSWGLRLLHFAR